MILVLLIGCATAVVLTWSVFKYHTISDALSDSYPAEFKEGTLWRTAFPIFVLSPSTPLDLQAGFLQSQAAFCFVVLGISLCCFLLEKTLAGWLLLIAFSGFVVLAIKSWNTYKANCARRMVRDDKDEL
jgi:Flp pilus assembly protein TadB